MFQLYLVTVLTNVLAGLALATGFLNERFERFSEYTDFMSNQVYRVILGAASALFGFINFFSFYDGDIPVIGDLFPSLSGIVAGVLLIAEFINSRKSENDSAAGGLADKVERLSGPYLTIIGVAAVIIGILHALLPQSPVL